MMIVLGSLDSKIRAKCEERLNSRLLLYLLIYLRLIIIAMNITSLTMVETSLLVAILFGIGVLFYRRFLSGHRGGSSQASGEEKYGLKVNGDKSSEGTWKSTQFEYPKIEPVTTPLRSIKPVTYRPFKWGKYVVAMGLRTMQWNEWIELDQEFERYFKIREERLRVRGERLLKTLPERPGIVGSGEPAAVELLYELAEFLSRRYPDVYRVTRLAPSEGSYGWYGQGQIKDITIVPLNRKFVIGEDDPLKISSLLIQEDFAIMVEGSDGRYYFQAGAVLIAGSWRMEDKLGMALDEIHTSGNVPQYQSKLDSPMARFFTKFPLDKPVARDNYTFQVVPEAKEDALDFAELAWAQTMKGSEDLKISEGQMWLKESYDDEDSKAIGQIQQDVSTPSYPPIGPSTVWLRVERETMRRLPRTGAVIFTIRTYQTRISELAKEPGVPGRIASALRSWPDDVARYKGHEAYEGIVEYLDECHAEQVRVGVYKEEVPFAEQHCLNSWLLRYPSSFKF
ncbi:hypothetical protein ABKN59_000084 [Abortiporus biennis]